MSKDKKRIDIRFISQNKVIVDLFPKVIEKEFITSRSDLINKALFEYFEKNYPQLLKKYLEKEGK